MKKELAFLKEYYALCEKYNLQLQDNWGTDGMRIVPTGNYEIYDIDEQGFIVFIKQKYFSVEYIGGEFIFPKDFPKDL